MTKKQNCSVCDKFTTNIIFILTGKAWHYEPYCINCARAFFGKLSTKNTMKLNKKEIQQCSYEWDSMINRTAIKLRNEGKKADFEELPYNWSQQIKNKI